VVLGSARMGAVFLGGCLGGLLRYAFVFLFPNSQGAFPLTIFLENVAGAFLLGLVMTAFMGRRGGSSPVWGAFFCTGVLGSFTTFSNLSVDVVQLIHHGEPFLGSLYFVSSTFCGLMAAFLGLLLGRWFLGVARR